jgi:hypothetical protein
MEFELDDIKKKIDDYFLGNLSKEELGEWAKKEYYDLLKGEFLELKKIIGYPFLKVISKFHIKEDDILNKVIAYLECYAGERNFGVDILFIS